MALCFLEEIIKRWHSIYQGTELGKEFLESTEKEKNDMLKNNKELNKMVEKYKERLNDISWFMKALKEYIAKKANNEDNVTGHFWEGRFKLIPIDTSKGYEKLKQTMAYVALNPIGAEMIDDPEYAKHTGL